MTTIDNLNDLNELLNSVPDGTESDILAYDLEAGNFETARFFLPDGTEQDVHYTGPVKDGYISPFEVQTEKEKSNEHNN